MSADWGYEKLHEHFEKRAIDEMKHAEILISRILFLEGTPIVSNLKEMFIGKDIPEMLTFDHKAEAEAIRAYNDAIKLAAEVKDFATGADGTDYLAYLPGQPDIRRDYSRGSMHSGPLFLGLFTRLDTG